ncbi:Os04g0374400 [Oryza sativa Japonica Group]|uniref:Os04g0374400 protein n=1 Tax=Oryza sativa subsp. japonica TaxID=39947 RepID=A0A0N7KIX6_ORYSJ|nr:Os04g0374400 [Oryza sativa Japonica Group]
MEGGVHIVSRRMVRPAAEHAGELPEHETVHHLTPLDLRMITGDYVQKGVVLPKPPGGGEHVVEHLVSSFARALARFYPLAGRLAVAETPPSPGGARPTISLSLRCNGEGAEFVHAVAPGVTVADIADSLFVPRVVWSFFPLNGMLGTDAAVEPRRPVLAAQATELADGMFIAMSLNHGVADGFTFWHLFRTWSEINRRRSGADNADLELSTPPPVFDRWFVDGIPAPIPLPFAKLEDMVRRPAYTPVEECFLHFSAESVRTLKEKANAEMAGGGGRRRHIVAPVGGRAHLASRVPSPPPRAGAGDEARPLRGTASAGQGGATRIHGQHGGGRRREGHRRRAPRERARLGGVAAEPRRGVRGRRGEREAHAAGVAGDAEVRDGGEPAERRRGGDLGLAAVRRVRQRLRVGEAGGRPERRRE